MKKAVFVSNPNDVKLSHEHPWQRKGGTIYNSRELDIAPGEGLVLFRHTFSLKKPVARVLLRATALGIFELYLNGSRVGDGQAYDELKPTWTDYRSRVFEYEYDITAMCGAENDVVAEVSAGWWSGRISFGAYGFRPSAFCGEIEIFYEDGAGELICDGWKTSIGGQVRFADIWDGEYFDARVASPALEPEKYDWIDAVETADVTCRIAAGRPPHTLPGAADAGADQRGRA